MQGPVCLPCVLGTSHLWGIDFLNDGVNILIDDSAKALLPTILLIRFLLGQVLDKSNYVKRLDMLTGLEPV